MTSTLADPTSLGHPGRDTAPAAAAPPAVAAHRVAGVVALASVVLCAVGALLNQALVDVDVYAAMDAASRAEQADLLTKVAAERTSIVAGFVVWMVAFPAICVSLILLAGLGRRSLVTDLVRTGAIASFGAMVVFLGGFITFTAVIAPAHVAGEDVYTVGRGIGWMSTTIDWTITAIVLGLAPIGAVVAGRDRWAPRWLQGLAGVTGAVTLLLVVGMLVDNRDMAFPLVPVGLVLIACSGICALRHANP